MIIYTAIIRAMQFTLEIHLCQHCISQCFARFRIPAVLRPRVYLRFFFRLFLTFNTHTQGSSDSQPRYLDNGLTVSTSPYTFHTRGGLGSCVYAKPRPGA